MTFLFLLPLLLSLGFFGQSAAETNSEKKPNIIFIIADDLGWNDVGFHGSNQIPTPNIDALAYSGVILNNYYVMPVCTPSRSALMTGKHPIHTGMQHRVIFANEPYGLPLEEKLLPEYLREQGYKNHIVGKWHLGHFQKEYTPLHRGFDSHFGYWSGHQDYYDHTAQESLYYWGYDMRRGMNVSYDSRGKYTTTLLTEEAVKVVHHHNTSEPLFLYLSHLATHSANPYLPLQAPDDVVKKFSYIEDKNRRIFAAMLSLLDESVGEVTKALNEKNMLNDSIIIFTTDNGGPAGGFNLNAASNWPLRGVKDSLWEGGVRGAALIWSPLIKNTPRVSHQLMHIQDWLPTLLSAIGDKGAVSDEIDGQDVWEAINDPEKGTYDDLLLVIDNQRNLSALIKRKDEEMWKLSQGTIMDGKFDKRIGPDGRDYKYDWEGLKNGFVAQAIKKTKCALPTIKNIETMRQKSQIYCSKKNNLNVSESRRCRPEWGEICLFNLDDDPCELNNLAKEQPNIVKEMLELLQKFNDTLVPPRNQPRDPASNPKCWDNVWLNWMDYPKPIACQSQ
ncbi:arylsulfatase B [Neocloeon triangulifer]|uniref:arylsulfatase B n=1 Tax=Neocloeon triangulifer TaxID=2078957 RepID=UPI00286F8022|nr:arylsulfatase B [Neocloeon triangulifer]